MGMMAMAYGIQDEDAWMYDGPATYSPLDEEVIPDDWAVNPPTPMTAENAVRTDEGERVSLAMDAWAEALGAPKAVAPALELRLLVQEETPDQYEDTNARERERWIGWAKRAHPEWGENPKPPRRLAPSMRLTRVGERGWATLVMVIENGYPEVVARRDLEGRVPEDLDCYWPRDYESLFAPTTKILRRRPVGEISLIGHWDWCIGDTTMRQKFPTLTNQRREWAKAHMDEINELMRKLV